MVSDTMSMVSRATLLTLPGMPPAAIFARYFPASPQAGIVRLVVSNDPAPLSSAFRPVPRTGVIYVTTEAQRRGFSPADPDWCNLGQGMPETGPLPGAPPRRQAVAIAGDDQEYAPVAGLWELREAVASFYNQQFRRGMPSQYSAENVAICGGGRAALTRAAAALGQINLGHFLPDYTAYEELLHVFGDFSPIPILLEGERGYEFTPADLRREIMGRGLLAVLASNPCNPTGKLVSGDDLAEWVHIARDLDCTLLLDEFYSHYIWRKSGSEPDTIVSAARYVEDVERDPVVIVDGLTKNWRYPGWRVSWTVGPRAVIDAVTSAGSFLDGGGSKPLQRAAVELVTVEHARAETDAIRAEFSRKRDLMLKRTRELGLVLDREPDATFYLWVRVDGLPASISDGMSFFRAALERKVIVVPGEFFDVNPGKRRAGRLSRFRRHVRLSFGPSHDNVALALDRLAAMVADARARP
jgi:aspartate/methionine/tyrosine aminotransferase